jgi:hypothetical protein
MQDYRVIYPGGDRTKLKVALVFDYEEDEYALASRRKFDQETEEDAAHDYAKDLARENGLTFVDERRGHHDYLD